jgi:hypothetical protein
MWRCAIGFAVLGLIGLSATGCGSDALEVDGDFDETYCPAEYTLDGVTFSSPFDSVEVLSVALEGASGGPGVVRLSGVGSRCAGAADRAACDGNVVAALAQVAKPIAAAAAPSDRWIATVYSGCCQSNFAAVVLTTKGSDVRVFSTPAELSEITGPVDTTAKAGLFLLLKEGGQTRLTAASLQCTRPNARRRDGVFEFVIKTVRCGDTYDEWLTRVETNGRVTRVVPPNLPSVDCDTPNPS